MIWIFQKKVATICSAHIVQNLFSLPCFYLVLHCQSDMIPHCRDLMYSLLSQTLITLFPNQGLTPQSNF